MHTAFLLGFGAASSLIIGAIIATTAKISKRQLGLIMAFGVGVLISAVAFELAEQAFETTKEGWTISTGLAAGALVFFVGDALIDRFGGRKHRLGGKDIGSGGAILLGTILDGIPESIVIGLALLHGNAINFTMFIAVFLSNLPEAISATSGLVRGGWSKIKIIGLWTAVALASGGAALAGYALFASAGAIGAGFTLAFAAGALLTMLASSMMPDAYRDSGKLVGLVTTLGFGLAFLISMLS